MTMLQHAILVLIIPLVSAAVIALFLRRVGGMAAAVSVVAATAIAAISVILALHGERFEHAQEWLRLGDFSLSLGIKFDDLAALMLVIVGIVGLCVHVFSLGYMHEDAAKARFFGGLSIREVAELEGVSDTTIESDWRFARAWLRDQLGGGSP